MPTYNYGRYLSQAIESVLSQSFADFELLIADDCSYDSTDEIMQKYRRQDPRIAYIRHDKNLGMVPNWNYCLRHAKGKYIKFLFGDDFFTSPQTLQMMFSVMENDDSISLVSTARRIVDDQSFPMDVWRFSHANLVIDGIDAIRHCLHKHANLIGEPTAVMFRASQSIRGFDPMFRQNVDLEMWFHLLEQGRYAFLADPLCAFRLHAQQQTKMTPKETILLEDARIYSTYLNKKNIHFKLIDKMFLSYDLVYRVWKECHRDKRIANATAKTYIENYGPLKFYLFFPIYKIYKPFRKLLDYIHPERHWRKKSINVGAHPL
jgi:glycosyltransferase involved in cell wall biosynthesis